MAARSYPRLSAFNRSLRSVHCDEAQNRRLRLRRDAMDEMRRPGGPMVIAEAMEIVLLRSAD